MKAFVAALCLVAAPAFANPAAEAKKAIDAANAKWMEAAAKGDGAAMAALYTEDAVVLPEFDPEIKGRQAIEQFFAGLKKGGVKEIKLTTTEVTVHGDVAVELGTYVLAMQGADGQVKADADHGKYIVIWKKSAGGWHFWRDIWNTSVTPRMPGAAEPKKD